MPLICDKPNNVFKQVFKKGRKRFNWWMMFERNKWQICIQQEGSKESVKKHMEKLMNKENVWDQNTEIGIVEGLAEEVSLKEITSAMNKMKLGKASRFSEVSME